MIHVFHSSPNGYGCTRRSGAVPSGNLTPKNDRFSLGPSMSISHREDTILRTLQVRSKTTRMKSTSDTTDGTLSENVRGVEGRPVPSSERGVWNGQDQLLGHETGVRMVSLEATYVRAVESLIRELEDIRREPQMPKGCIRIEVPLSRGISALQWLKSQTIQTTRGEYILYFSSKTSSAPDTSGSIAAEAGFYDMSAVAGIGAAWEWKGIHGCPLNAEVMHDIKEKTNDRYNRIKAFGGSRFDPGGCVDEEWESFGSFCFLIPRIEFVERGNGCVLACTLAWDAEHRESKLSSANILGYCDRDEAVRDALTCLSNLQGVSSHQASGVCSQDSAFSLEHTPDVKGWNTLMDKVQNKLMKSQHDKDGNKIDDYSISATTALDEYLRNGQKGLDDLLAASRSDRIIDKNRQEPDHNNLGNLDDGLVKLVLARRTRMTLKEDICGCDLLAAIQERDPKAYQFMLGLPNGKIFLGCTPERLYARSARHIVSEAVAGTRGRGPGGDIEKDFWLAFDLLQSQKDGLEFQLVRDSIMKTFKEVCISVDLEVEKSVLKQGSVQHLYGRIAGRLRPDVDDLDLIQELHPTPAVCGQPDDDAMCLLRSFESFDRGFYAGPFGWFSKNAADIAVAIRSSLVETGQSNETPVSLYAGVGIVPGSVTQSEWNELDLKISQFTRIFSNNTKRRIMESQNLSILAAQIMVEELCRCGCNTFCVAPGSRSSPLTLAVAQHPRARLVPGIDERSLGFWALGHGKATGRPCVVITSSGTAVANLLPAVVESSQSSVPLILLTADRPAELRDSGSNQTINQVGIFGKYVRWDADLIPPSPDVPLRNTVSVVSHAYKLSTSPFDSGPVHINCQFREPLNPVSIEWNKEVSLQGLESWLTGKHPFTIVGNNNYIHRSSSFQIESSILQKIVNCPRGLLVVGETSGPEDVSAAKEIAALLGWPVVADILSGMRVGSAETERVNLIDCMDHLLLQQDVWEQLRPDVILHLGSRLTSKRLISFLEWTAITNQENDISAWILSNKNRNRYDPSHLLDARLDCSISDLLEALSNAHKRNVNIHEYANFLLGLNAIAQKSINEHIENHYCMSEAHVAKAISRYLPKGDGLFVGNSMPIRDLDMFCSPRSYEMDAMFPGCPIAANRGASGIDGVLSSAAGYADGLQRKCTLVIGDVSFLHDTNGLNLLRTGGTSPALTVVLINNSGGGIFDFLPIAGDVPDDQFRPLWTTPQYVDIAGLCRAQGIPHMKVTDMSDLKKCLESSWALNRHCVLEVVTEIRSNVDHHDLIKEEVCNEIGKASGMGIIKRVRTEHISIPLHQRLTTFSGESHMYRNIIYIMMDVSYLDGQTSRVIGEVAPLPGLHKEDIAMASKQISNLCKHLQGSRFLTTPEVMSIYDRIPLFQRIIQHLKLTDIYPSVKSGLEAALWEAVDGNTGVRWKPRAAKVSALLNPHGHSDSEIEEMAKEIVSQGYRCIKVKAGRSKDPLEDARYLKIIRKAVGDIVTLRVDSNQCWSFKKAIQYVSAVETYGIEYIEEPLSDPMGLSEWSKFSSIPVALDESLDQGLFDVNDPSCSIPDSVKYVVIKPSLLGGMSETAKLSKAAESRGIDVVISSCFESPVGLVHLAKISSLVDSKRCRYHGISTETWFADEIPTITCTDTDVGRVMPNSHSLGFINTFSISTGHNDTIPSSSFSIEAANISWNIVQVYPHINGDILNPSKRCECTPIVLLHGIFGSSSEMQELAHALGACQKRPVLIVDLPGHGESRWSDVRCPNNSACMLSTMADSLVTMLASFKSCTLIGYSLGARLSLLAGLQHPKSNISNVISISGGIGISEDTARLTRAEKDAEIASRFDWMDRHEFFNQWYGQPLWNSLRSLKGYDAYVQFKASSTIDPQKMISRILKECSPGKSPSVREELIRHKCKPRILLLAGERDDKYASMIRDISIKTVENEYVQTAMVRGVGHAMHLENAEAVAHAILEHS